MKRLLAVLIAIAIAMPAHAVMGTYRLNGATPVADVAVPQNMLPTGRKPVAFVWNSHVFDPTLNGSSIDRDYFRAIYPDNVGRLPMLIKDQGSQIDVYQSRNFEEGYGSKLWRELGTYYGAVVFIGGKVRNGLDNDGGTQSAVMQKFYCADSTTAHVIHYSLPDWLDDWADGGSAAKLMGTGAYSAGNNYFGLLNTPPACNFGNVTAAGDSMFAGEEAVQRAAMNSTIRGSGADSTKAGIVQILPYFRSRSEVSTKAFATTYGGSNDPAAWTNVPINNDPQFYADSLATVAEIMPIAWRTRWASGATMDFVMLDPTIASRNATTSQYLYAIIARYVKLDPIKTAYEWDDHGTFGFDDSTGSAGGAVGSQTRMWPNQDTLYAWKAQLSSFGIPNLETTGSADSLYAMATTTQTGQSGAHTYSNLRDGTWYFVPHVHDSTTDHVLGNVLGMGTTIACRAGCNAQFDRYAMRPPSTQTYNWETYSVWYRLYAQDSAYTARFGPGVRAPYLSFPSDISVPKDMSTQGLNNVLRWPAGQVTEWMSCDSLFRAFANAGKFYLRDYQDGGTDSMGARRVFASAGTIATINGYSTPGVQRLFGYADERYSGGRCNVAAGLQSWADSSSGTGRGGYVIRGIGTFGLTATAAITSAPKQTDTRSYQNAYLPFAMGLQYRPTRQRVGRPADASTSSSDSTARLVSWSKWNSTFVSGNTCPPTTDLGRIRIIYQHPLSTRFIGYPAWAQDKVQMYNGILAPLAALTGIARAGTAGNTDLVRWVQPWQVYN